MSVADFRLLPSSGGTHIPLSALARHNPVWKSHYHFTFRLRGPLSAYAWSKAILFVAIEARPKRCEGCERVGLQGRCPVGAVKSPKNSCPTLYGVRHRHSQHLNDEKCKKSSFSSKHAPFTITSAIVGCATRVAKNTPSGPVNSTSVPTVHTQTPQTRRQTDKRTQ